MKLSEAIGATTGQTFEIANRRAIHGGDINQAELLKGRDGRRFFVKFNLASRLAMFEAEADGLAELDRAGAIRVPKPVCSGVADQRAYLVLEYLELGGHGDAVVLGQRLAGLHRAHEQRFGWWRDNTIGSTRQSNAWQDNWVAFLRVHRLGYQFRLAEQNGAPASLISLGERLLADLDGFFHGHTVLPSLLHGDLWVGNFAYAKGEPVLFDPAVYYGDREADLAMTELFGGFPAAFYDAYQDDWPLDPGYPTRKTLYNLYHILNHYNLFGASYASQAQHMIGQLLAELG